jgi:hypothetical protein
LEIAAWAEYYRRDYEAAHRFADDAMARSDDPGVRTSCLAVSGRILHASGDLTGADRRLTEAVQDAPIEVRGFAQVWLAGVRLHQGRTAETLDLLERAFAQPLWLGHPFAVHHGGFFRTIALSERGRLHDAFRSFETARSEAVAAGEAGVRLAHALDNVQSSLLRAVGRHDDARAVSSAVIDATRGGGSVTSEMFHAALLDHLDFFLETNDLDGATTAMTAAAPVEQLHGTMAWRHRHRYWMQQARFAVQTDDLDRASALVARLMDDAEKTGTTRYVRIGTVVDAIAAARRGEAIDHDRVDAALSDLDQCGSLEAWRLTAELATVTNVDPWWRDAEERAAGLVAQAGPDADRLRAYVIRSFAALGRS